MTRSLRKRHLFTWIIITVIVLAFLVIARQNIPVFEGEVTHKEAVK